MKLIATVLAVLSFLVVTAPVQGQDNASSGDKKSAEVRDKKGNEVAVVSSSDDDTNKIPLKVQVLITEFAGSQKLSSLPYILYTIAYPEQYKRAKGNHQLRFGVKVPVETAANQFTYMNVGTNIDCQATQAADGKFNLQFSVERESITTRGANGEESEWKPGSDNPGPQPLVRSFVDSFVLEMRDGNTVEGTSAVDPVTGHLLKVEVTLNVIK